MIRNAGISRKVIILSFVSLFTDMASEMLYPVMPAYLRSIGFSVFFIGILEGLAEAVAGLSKGFFGQWSDHLNKRLPFVKSGYSLSALSKPMLAISTFAPWVFLARTADRLGKGIRSAPRDALLAAEGNSSKRGAVFGFHRAMDTVGAILGPLLAVGIMFIFPGNYRLLFLIAFIPGVFAVWLTFRIKEHSYETTHKPRPGWAAFLLYIKSSGKQYKKLLFILLLFALFNSSDVFILLRLKETGLTDTVVLLLYLLYNLIFALSAYPIGNRSDKTGMKLPTMIGFLLFAVSYLMFAFSTSIAILIAALVLYGLYAAFTEGISKAWISLLSDKSESGTAIGAYMALQSIAMLLASTLTGALWSGINSQFALVFAAGGAIISLLLLAFLKIANNTQ